MNRNAFIILSMSLLLIGCKPRNNFGAHKEFTNKIEDLVVEENQIGQEYRFEVAASNRILKYSLIYIGSIKTNHYDSLKVLYKSVLSGNETPQANSYLIIFDNSNKNLGRYYIAATDAPKVQGESLVFKDELGDCTETTTISFKDSIPQSIFIRCRQKDGNIFGDEYGFAPNIR